MVAAGRSGSQARVSVSYAVAPATAPKGRKKEIDNPMKKCLKILCKIKI